MPGGGFAPSDDFDETRPAGTDYGYDIDRWCASNLQHICNAYAIEHYEMSNDPDESEDDFGRHDFITLKEQALKPDLSASTDRTGLYTKSDGVYIEKDDATEIKILDFTTERSDVDNDVPSGEIILFEKDTAVTGYSLLTTKNDMAVYITKGLAAGGEEGATDKSGGTWTIAGLTADSHTHTGPNHNHQWYNEIAGADDASYGAGGASLDIAQTSNANLGISTYSTYRLSKDYYTNSAGTGNTGAPSTTGITSNGTWRPSGRNFTRQQRD